MKLIERLNVLIQAITLSQKNGILTLDEAVKAKSAIDIISSGVINQNYAAAINVLIEITASSQKKGVYTLKDAHMIYLAVENIEVELQNEVSRINEEMMKKETNRSMVQPQVSPQIENEETKKDSGETIITIPPKTFTD
jgi:phenylalanyl-tRNA synthetase alpha subunit